MKRNPRRQRIGHLRADCVRILIYRTRLYAVFFELRSASHRLQPLFTSFDLKLIAWGEVCRRVVEDA
jgi:hypothetical protein